MEFFVTLAGPAKQRTDCAIVGVYDKGTLSAAAEELDKRIGGRIARLVKRGDLRGKAGDSVMLADLPGVPVERVLVIGLGGRNTSSASSTARRSRARWAPWRAPARRMRSATSASTASAMRTPTR